jgi:hypothetical protein
MKEKKSIEINKTKILNNEDTNILHQIYIKSPKEDFYEKNPIEKYNYK